MWYYPAFAELPRRSQASIATAEVGGMTSSLSQVQDPGVVDRLRAYEITYDRFQIELCCCYYCGGITCGNGNAVMITGWSGIVVGMWGIGWISAMLLFCDGLTGRTTQLVGAGVMTLVSLLIAWPLAQTSTQCSNLIDHLNKQRMFNLALHERLTALETALRQHNMGKGLGFVVGGIVVDTRLLSQAFLGVFSILSTVIPMVILLRPGDPTACSLTDLQKAAFQSTAAAMNLTCTFNMSVGPGGLITDLSL